MQRQPSGFDDMDFSTLNSLDDSIFDDDFDDVFAAKYEPFLIGDEPEYDMLEFNDLRFAAKYLLTSAFISESGSKSISCLASLKLKPFLDSLK